MINCKWDNQENNNVGIIFQKIIGIVNIQRLEIEGEQAEAKYERYGRIYDFLISLNPSSPQYIKKIGREAQNRR